MRTFPGTARALSVVFAVGVCVASAPRAEAQNFNNGNNPYYLNNQTYSYGLQLPQVPQPNGQDEIRAADGTTCRSSMASNNAYLDVGGIGGQGQDGSFDSGTVYGRLILPLGNIPNRLDCSSLYGLEIERLKHELELVRSGAGGGLAAAPSGGKDKAWAEKGWGNSGWKAGANSKDEKPGKLSAADNIPAAVVVPMRLTPKDTVAAVSSYQPTSYQPTAPPSHLLPANLEQAEIEILPWSNRPAEPARVLAGIPSKPKFKLDENVSPQQLVR